MPDPDLIPDPPPIPPAVPPAPVVDPPTAETRSVICEFCKSKLDRRGRILERGAKVRELMDHEDTIDTLKKQLAKERDAHEATRIDLAAARAELAPVKARRFGQLV